LSNVITQINYLGDEFGYMYIYLYIYNFL
jgi:hypothetical protein